MPPSDVVKHDLTTLLQDSPFDWMADVEAMPLPVVPEPDKDIPRLAAKPPVTTRVSATELTSAPYRSVGKMRLVIGGDTKDATGWVVAPRAFITAGHCVYYEKFGGWITQAELCPRFDNACTKSYKVTTVYALKGWVDSTDWGYDMAACVVSETFATTEPPLPFHTGVIPAFKFTAIGYPLDPISTFDFNGKRMWKSVGALVDFKDDLTWAENNLTHGASGGPWCDPADNYKVSGLTSKRRNDPDQAASPGFVNGFQNLYDAVKNLK